MLQSEIYISVCRGFDMPGGTELQGAAAEFTERLMLSVVSSILATDTGKYWFYLK